MSGLLTKKSGKDKKAALDKGAKDASSGGTVGGDCLPCKKKKQKWTLKVRVRSVEKDFWPTKEKVEIRLVGISGTSGTKKKTVKHAAQTSPEVEWDDTAKKDYRVEARIKGDKLRKWELVQTETVSLSPGDAKTVELKIKFRLTVFLRFVWLDPEDKERVFPEGFPVRAVFDVGTTQDLTIGKDGKLSFQALPPNKKFTLRFQTPDTYIASEPDKAPAATTEKLKAAADTDQLLKDKWRFFMVPERWSLLRADWGVTGATTYDTTDTKFTITEDDIGTDASPVKLKLDPHWQFLRFEFFDRFHGHDPAHDHKRVSLPLLAVEGERENPKTRGPVADPDTRAAWMVKPTDRDTACHCVPWIIQKKPDGAAERKPDDKILLQLVTPADTFVHCKSVDDRVVEVVGDADKQKPSAERLKLYDLPRLWKSDKYFTRLVGGGDKPFNELALAKIYASEDHGGRLTFSLDDIVLTDDSLHRIVLDAGDTSLTPPRPPDRVAVFYHKFKEAAEAGKTSKVGVYKYDDGGKESFHTKYDGDAKDRLEKLSLLIDYPNWVRLVTAQGSCFDAFDQRTPDEDPNTIVGARAAVRWVDSPAVGGPAGNVISPRPARTDKPFFSTEPYFEQLYNQTNRKYQGAATPNTQSIGRYEMVLLRCCGHDGDKEEIVNLHYFRMFFYGGKVPSISAGPGLNGTPTADSATIHWNTDIPTTAKIDYGTTAAYGNTVWSGTDTATYTSITLSGLAANTVYHYSVTVYDPSNNKSSQKDFVFRTAGAGAAPGAPAVSTTNTDGPYSPKSASGTSKLKEFAEGAAKNIIKRFNGDDTVSTVRAELLPQKDTDKIKGQIVYYIEAMPAEARAHFRVQVVVVPPERTDGATPRNWMGGYNGTGEMGEAGANGPEGEYSQPQAYTAAHETGHGNSLPDEYNERWNAHSYSEAGVRCNTPGDAYEDDGVTWDDFSASAVKSGLMTGVVAPRNRYYWHGAAFAHAATGIKFKVKLGTYDDYKVPPHEQAPKRSYIWWPIEDKIDDPHQFREFREFTFKTAEGTKPSVTGASSNDITATGVTIEWSTQVDTDSEVEYGTTGGYGSSTKGPDVLVKSHSVRIEGLTPNTRYHVRAKSTAANGESDQSRDITFKTPATAGPVIAGVAESGVTAAAASIGFTTDKDAKVAVEYGTTPSLGSSTAGPAAAAKNHNLALAGLTAATRYFYRVQAKDDAGNESFSTTRDFWTDPTADPVITEIEVILPSSTSALIRWKSDYPTIGKVAYKLDSADAWTWTPPEANKTLEHEITLTGLTTQEIYNFAVKSSGAAGKQKTSDVDNFTPVFGAPPRVSEIKAKTVVVTWGTDAAVTSQVEYGTGGYDHSFPTPASAATTNHSVKLTGLTPDTEYKARVRSPTDTGAGLRDLMVFPLGKEQYSQDNSILDKGPYQGIMVVMIKLRVTTPKGDWDAVKKWLRLMRSEVKSKFNQKFYAKGKVRVGSDQEWEFQKCLVLFSPRFLVVNGSPATGVANEVTNVGVHYDVVVTGRRKSATSFVQGTSRAELSLHLDLASATWENEVRRLFREGFAKLIGMDDFAAVTHANLKPLAQKVITTSGDVADLT